MGLTADQKAKDLLLPEKDHFLIYFDRAIESEDYFTLYFMYKWACDNEKEFYFVDRVLDNKDLLLIIMKVESGNNAYRYREPDESNPFINKTQLKPHPLRREYHEDMLEYIDSLLKVEE